MAGKFLLPGEAGWLLGLGPAAVRRLCDAGRLPCTRSENGWRLIPRNAVERLRREREQRRARGRRPGRPATP